MSRVGGLIRKTLAFFRRRRGRLYFWLLNGGLLLLYGWTLTESVPIVVRAADESCLAVLEDRTAEIPCPGLSQGEIGLYLEQDERPELVEAGPLDYFAPRAAWHQILLSGGQEDSRPFEVTFTDQLIHWRRFGDEWRPLLEQSALRWRTPVRETFTVQASIRRPEGELAGILLLEPGGQSGWMFRVDTEDRQAGWWRWEEGRPSEFLLGIPFQKSLTAQTQSLLRLILRGHHGALLLLLAGRLLHQALRRLPFPTFKPSPAHFRYGVGLLAFLMLSAAVFIAVELLERVPHVQDSVTMLFQAQLIAAGRAFAPAPTLPQFFEQEFLTVWNGRWFGQYPPGFPLLLSFGVLFKLPWLVNPLLAVLAVPLLYKLGSVLFGRKEGLLAAVLAFFSPYYLFMSGSHMVHPAELFWTLLFLLGWVSWLRGRSWRWLLAAGAALGMILLTRQVTVAAVGGAIIAFTLLAARTGRFGLPFARPKLRELFIGAAITGLSAAPFALFLLGWQWAVTGDPLQDPRLISRPFDRPGFGLDLGGDHNAFTYELIEGEPVIAWYTDPDLPPRGHTPARGLFNTLQNWESLAEHLFGWLPFLTLAFCWLVFTAARPSFGDWLLLALMSAVVAVYISYWAAGIMYGPRYYYAALPAFLLLTARGVFVLAQRLGSRSGQWAALGLAAIFIIGNVLTYMPEAAADARGFNFVSGAPLAAVEQAVGGEAVVFVSGDAESWWEYGQFFSGNTPWLDGRIIYARDLGLENGRLLALYPGRSAYCWNGTTNKLDDFPCGN